MSFRSTALVQCCSALVVAAVLAFAPDARAACVSPPNNPENDCDLDGQTIQQGDCNDSATDPGAPLMRRFGTEVCDAYDNDCDGTINEGLYVDADADGVRQCGTCQAPAAGSCDCDDTRSNVRPGQAEICDGRDNDCDALIDERNPAGDKLQRSCYTGPAGTQGVGVCAAGLETCNSSTPGTESWAGCTQTLPSNPPANPEPAGSCNGIDNDCDGVIDDGLVVDADGDNSRLCGSCGAPAAPNCDCNDTNNAVRPGATEQCNGVDDDCDASTDEGIAARICYEGPAGTFTGTCPGPTCNARGPQCVEGTQTCSGGSFGTCGGDTWPVGVNPAAAETNCNGVDDDCDGVIDDGQFVDADGDGYRLCGSCGAPAAPNCDCNDGNSAIRPGATETCDNVDNDCDGSTDESLSRICYEGPAGTFTGTCPGGSCNARGPQCVEGSQTCSAGVWGTCGGDTWPAGVNPAASEASASPQTCGVDDDCDGTIDDGLRTDADGDGSYACGGVCANAPPNCDCNDANGTIRPGRPELCNGVDDDCDGTIDEGLLDDTDGDGFRQCGTCGAPAAPNCDCNDNNNTIFPGAPELCDCVDQNCNGSTFDGFPDVDNDGVPACAGAAVECNDSATNGNRQHAAWCTVAAVAETCDALDNDCDTLVDERDTSGNKLRRACYTGPPGTAGVGTCVTGLETCNATTPPTASWSACVGQVVPATETCNGTDEDCDGTADDGLIEDADGDGYRACYTCQAQPVPNCDCNDSDAAVHPGATEVCDSVDQDCDGQPNDVPARTCFVGANVTPATYTGICPGPTCDPRGACVAGSQLCLSSGAWGACTGQVLPTNDPALGELTCDNADGDCDGQVDDGNFDVDGDGSRTCDGDCNDNNPAIRPGAAEICDNLDNDCNGTVDGTTAACYTGPAGTEGVGRCHAGTATCTAGQPSGACNGEVLPSNAPNEPETICNGTDDDCDGQVDDGFDADGDGAFSCSRCPVYSAAVCDCDDDNRFLRPGQREICDCEDNNCTGGVDEGGVCVGAPCFDFDADGFTNCQGDCDDQSGVVNPVRTEVVGNGIDDDCDGALDENVDEDADGFTTGANDCNDHLATVNPGAVEVCDGFDNDCDGNVDEGFDVDGDLVSSCAGDCNDNNVNVNPFAIENCSNGIDDDCDGNIDQPLMPNGQPRDDDGDGVTLCQGDCNDHNAQVYAAGGSRPSPHPEVCDGIDNDCDAQTDEGFDMDGDFVPTCFGDCNDANPNVSSQEYERPGNGVDDDCDGQIDEGATDVDGDGFTPNCGDCNDADPNINPHATEACDRVDNNCDSYIDSAPNQFDLCATCFDSDGDGVTNCDGDCNDNDDRIYRAAPEVCDGLDNDCDGAVDLDAFGLRVCEGDGGFDGGTGGDGGVDGGTGDGGVEGDGGIPEELPPEVLVGCGCSSGSGGGAGTSQWVYLAIALMAALARVRRMPRLGRLGGARRLAVTATLGFALVVSGTGCDSLLRYRLDVRDGGAGDGGDGGPDDPILLPVEWKCGTQAPAAVRAERLPASQIPFAVPVRFTSTVVGGDAARALEDEPAEVAAFAIRRELPSDISPTDLSGAETIGVRELAVIDTLTGTPLIAESQLRFNQIFPGPTFSASYRVELGANSDVYTLRNRFLSFFTGKGLGELGTLPRPSSGTQTDLFVINVMYRIVGNELVVLGAVTPDAKLGQNQSTLLDFSNGSAVGPVGSVLASACEHRTLPALQSDFIFVVDNSGSMSEEQAALSDAASALYAGFVSSGLDFRLGVITTDGEALQGNGFTTSQVQFENDVNVGIGGGTTEQGLEYGMRAVELARTHPDPSRRLRSTAGVVMVFYSDEESANLMTVAEYADYFNSEGVTCYAIVGPKPSGCSRVGLGNAVAGASYIDVAAATGGTSGSICNPNLSETIQEVLLGALGAASRSPLVRRPVSSTIAVRTAADIARSRANGFDYEPGANTVLFFGSVPPTGTEFQVAYQFFVSLQ